MKKEKSSKSTYRCDEDRKKLINRLNIISGQVNGIKQMIEEDRYCDDVLIQVAATTNALKSLGNNILEAHLKSCVTYEILNGNKEIIDDVMDIIKKIR